MSADTAFSGGWYICHECGIHRRVGQGQSTICEINGAGSRMEPISDATAYALTCGDKAIVRLEKANERLRDALDTIAAGHAFGPQEVARAALASPDGQGS